MYCKFNFCLQFISTLHIVSDFSGVYAYVVLKDDILEPVNQIKTELRDIVKRNIASYAVPEMVQVIYLQLQIFFLNRVLFFF